MKATLTIDGKEFDVEITTFEFMTKTLPSATITVRSNEDEFECLVLKHMNLMCGKITSN